MVKAFGSRYPPIFTNNASYICIAFLAIASAVSADFAFTSPKENAVYYPGDKVKFAWHDYSSKNKTITLVLANQGKAHHWHPYKTLAHLRRPFPKSYTWHVPEDFSPDRYFLGSSAVFKTLKVITDSSRNQAFSEYFFIKDDNDDE